MNGGELLAFASSWHGHTLAILGIPQMLATFGSTLRSRLQCRVAFGACASVFLLTFPLQIAATAFAILGLPRTVGAVVDLLRRASIGSGACVWRARESVLKARGPCRCTNARAAMPSRPDRRGVFVLMCLCICLYVIYIYIYICICVFVCMCLCSYVCTRSSGHCHSESRLVAHFRALSHRTYLSLRNCNIQNRTHLKTNHQISSTIVSTILACTCLRRRRLRLSGRRPKPLHMAQHQPACLVLHVVAAAFSMVHCVQSALDSQCVLRRWAPTHWLVQCSSLPHCALQRTSCRGDV